MADSPNLPGAHAWRLSPQRPNGPPDMPMEFFKFLRELVDYIAQTDGNSAELADILARLEELESQTDADIVGLQSVQVLGTLADGEVVLQLRGDEGSPGNTYYYGTDGVGDKGYNPVSDAFTQGDGVQLTTGSDGVTEIAHGDTSSVADISASFTGGTVPDEISLTFDEFGHVLTRTITGRTLDHNDTGSIQGGNTTERYHFTEAEHTGLLPWASEDPADYALITQTITNGDTTHSPSGDAVFDALATKADDSAVVHLAGTETITGDKSATGLFTWASNGSSGRYTVSTGVLPTWQFVGDSFALMGRASPNANSGGLYFVKSRGATPGSHGDVIASDQLGAMLFEGSLGGVMSRAAAIVVSVSGTPGSTIPGIISFQTRNAAGTLDNRLRITPEGTMEPGANNAYDIGSTIRRWREIFAINGTINTSDAREKTVPRDLTSAELSCAADLAALPSMFQWLHAIEAKGDDARLHCSPTVQSVIACMESHGLDPFRYGFVCYDKWDEQPEVWSEWPEQEEVRDEDGNVIQPAIEAGRELVQEYRPAGDLYSLRPSELQFFIARGQEERLRKLEALLS